MRRLLRESQHGTAGVLHALQLGAARAAAGARRADAPPKGLHDHGQLLGAAARRDSDAKRSHRPASLARWKLDRRRVEAGEVRARVALARAHRGAAEVALALSAPPVEGDQIPGGPRHTVAGVSSPVVFWY